MKHIYLYATIVDDIGDVQITVNNDEPVPVISLTVKAPLSMESTLALPGGISADIAIEEGIRGIKQWLLGRLSECR